MQDFRLVPPTAVPVSEITALRSEFLAETSLIQGGNGLERFDDPQDWLAHCEMMSDPATLPEGYVEAEAWLLVRGDEPRILGLVSLRRSIDHDRLREYGGHIGYSIRPSERGKGLAKIQLELTLERCRALNLGQVLLTCQVDNEASRRTMIACGGIFDRLSTEITADGQTCVRNRFWITL
ncbi:MAG: GNAT family N-acetyltransferase [Propionibacteriaceae bacterium]|jgi:predicted acetyltransferase|nr:GNAT family N-acetyltransferase [Propionibacteriaceae bacterium]